MAINGLDWIGLDWIELNWIGLDWIGLNERNTPSAQMQTRIQIRWIYMLCLCVLHIYIYTLDTHKHHLLRFFFLVQIKKEEERRTFHLLFSKGGENWDLKTIIENNFKIKNWSKKVTYFIFLYYNLQVSLFMSIEEDPWMQKVAHHSLNICFTQNWQNVCVVLTTQIDK